VWNSSTNQMAVLLIENGLPQVFSEPGDGTSSTAPEWPGELKNALNDANSYQDSLKDRLQNKAVDSVNKALGTNKITEPAKALMDGKAATEVVGDQLQQQSDKASEKLHSSLATPDDLTTTPQAAAPSSMLNSVLKATGLATKDDQPAEPKAESPGIQIPGQGLFNRLKREFSDSDE